MTPRILAALALCLAVRAADPYPAGTITRIYAGDVSGSVGTIRQSATAQGEITGTPEDFASTNVAAFRVRGMFVSAPILGESLRGKWSNYIGVNVTGYPFRAVAEWEDGAGLVMAYPAADWSTLTLEATGSIRGISSAVTFDRTTLALVETRTNAAAPVVETNAPAPSTDAVTPSPWRTLGKHKVDPLKTPITRQLYSADNRGGEVAIKFEPLGWTTETGGNGKTIDGGVCIAWQDGDTWTGGLFDHHGKGQTVKTQANIPGGYLDGKQPPKGAPVFYFLINRERNQRTNLAPGGVWK